MANLLTRKIMENMSRQYKKDHYYRDIPSIRGQEGRGNINSNEEALLLSLIKKNESPNHRNLGMGGQRLNLDDLAGYKNKGNERKVPISNKLSLEELAQRQK